MQTGSKIALALTLAVFAASWIAAPWPVKEADMLLATLGALVAWPRRGHGVRPATEAAAP